MELTQQQIQKQIISQNMIQSMNILQLNSMELAEYLKEASMENPVIELEDSSASYPENEWNKKEEQIKKLEWLQNLDEQNCTYYRDGSEEDEVSPINFVQDNKPETIEDVLMQQLLTGGYSKEQLRVFKYIAQNLDAKGYFVDGIEATARDLGISEKEVEAALAIMQELEPAGICAENLKACLIKQLEHMEKADAEEISISKEISIPSEIVRQYFDLLGKNQLPVIAKKLHLPIEAVKKAVDTIKMLNPRPAAGYGDTDKARYIVPDVNVVKFQAGFEILINNYSYPAMRISKTYMNMLQNQPTAEVKEYLLKNVEQAERIRENITRRNTTLLELTRCIVSHQTEFFNHGKSALKPLMQKTVAKEMEVNESTISRALKDKYLQCCFGTFPMTYFFDSGLGDIGVQGESVAQAASVVKEHIVSLIAAEDKKSPLSDDAIAEKLQEMGITISRRTVVKYRESIGIANSRGRKEF